MFAHHPLGGYIAPCLSRILNLAELLVPRPFSLPTFRKAYADRVVAGNFQEEPGYYPRYRSRYECIVKYFASVAPEQPADVLDIGGGQFAVLVKEIWQDRAAMADIDREHMEAMAKTGFRTLHWNLLEDKQPATAEFDVIIMSEVIEHLPIPSHIVLERLRKALRPGGVLICSTPNLYRWRNIIYLLLGKSPFDHFHYPVDSGLGHQLEFSEEHLHWQLERAGFREIRIDRVSLPHAPKSFLFRVLKWLAWPMTWFPRYRDCLVAVAKA